MTEAELQQVVVQLARHSGWLCHHSRPGMMRSGRWATPIMGNKGLPDIILVRERVLWVELKSEKGKLSPEQVQWIEALKAAGQSAYVWRPEHWLDGTIEAVLRRRA